MKHMDEWPAWTEPIQNFIAFLVIVAGGLVLYGFIRLLILTVPLWGPVILVAGVIISAAGIIYLFSAFGSAIHKWLSGD